MSTAGPPLCPCGLRAVAPLKSHGIRNRWAEEEGISRSRVTSSKRGGASVAYFHFCEECHARIWPDDRRPPNGNRWTRPASRLMPTFQASVQGRRRLLTGDLYITESPPELLSAGAQDQARRRRPPTPRRQCLVKEFLAGARKPGFTPASPSAEPVPLYRILRRRAVGGGDPHKRPNG